MVSVGGNLTIAYRCFVSQFRPAEWNTILSRIEVVGSIAALVLVLWAVGLIIARLWQALDRGTSSPEWYREPPSEPRGLVVLVHGWRGSKEQMREIAEIIGGMPKYRRFGIFLWDYPAPRLSNRDPRTYAQELRIQLDDIHEQCGGEVVLVGHSIGGLLVRSAWLEALEKKSAWAGAVTRIALLAAPNRGTLAIKRSIVLRICNALATSFGVARLIQSVYRGAPFVVNLRISWIRQFSNLSSPPAVYQLIGTADSQVSMSDSSDVIQFPTAIQREILNATHDSIVRGSVCGRELTDLLDSEQNLSSSTLAEKQNVIKVLLAHGIRDYGDRFRDIADMAAARGAENQITVIPVAPRYRYFSALQFVNPLSRKKKIHEFADMYAELLAAPPVDAPIDFIGHSFGTYLMMKSSQEYDSISFNRAYLAGSVMREDFLKDNNILGDRIKFLRNDIATKDWPVGILCSALDQLHLARDVGTAGFNGFTEVLQAGKFDEIRYYDGGHGAALEADNRPNIMNWLFQKNTVGFDSASVKAELRRVGLITSDRPGVWKLMSRIAPSLLMIVVLGSVYLIFVGQQPLLAGVELFFLAYLLNII